MIKWPEHLCCEIKLKESGLLSLEKRMLQRDLKAASSIQKGKESWRMALYEDML